MSRTRFLRRQAERLKAALDERASLNKTTGERKVEQAAGQSQNNLQSWQGLVEQRIQDGLAQGLFDNLQGTGKPLNLWDDAFVPEELRMAFRILRSNGLAPLWIEVNKEIQDDIVRLHRLRDYAAQRWVRVGVVERDKLREQYVERIREINSKIQQHNLLAPSSYVHLALLHADDELATFDAMTRSAH